MCARLHRPTEEKTKKFNCSAFSAEQIVKKVPFHFSEKKKKSEESVSAEHRQPDLIPIYLRLLNVKWWLFTNKRSNLVIDEGFLLVNFVKSCPRNGPKC